MSDEFELLNNKVPDFNAALLSRIKNKTQDTVSSTFDPHKLMVQKKQQETSQDYTSLPAQSSWPEDDVKKLELYCQRMGIVGFNCGRIPPIVALAMLKKQLGDDFTDVPMEQRTIPGYTNPASISNKQLLHG